MYGPSRKPVRWPKGLFGHVFQAVPQNDFRSICIKFDHFQNESQWKIIRSKQIVNLVKVVELQPTHLKSITVVKLDHETPNRDEHTKIFEKATT